MSDIVERLRRRSPYLDGSSAERTMDEAANAIERLRHRVDTLEGMLGEMNVAVPDDSALEQKP